MPLGQLLRRARNAKTALERHQAAYYLWEAALKLLASAAIVEYSALGDTDRDLAERLKNLARPSLGHWWEFVRRLLPVLADSVPGEASFREARDLVVGRARDDLPRAAGLDALLRDALEGSGGSRSTVRLSELFDRLVRYRNQEFGHGAVGQRPAEHYDRLGSALLSGIAEILERLDVLLGRRLLFVSDVRRKASGAWLVERYELRGESARRIESLELPGESRDDLPRPARAYLAASAGSPAGPRSLHPLVLFDPEAGEFFFLNSRRGQDRVQYLSYSTGRVVDREELGGDQRELLARVLGVEVDPDAARSWAERSQREEPEEPKTAGGPARRTIGEFELLSRIGRGGMGVVYRAWQPSLSRQVALKCLLGAGDPKVEARFAREIRSLGRVEHPNLVKIFTSGSEGDQWFYAMELIEGADLASVTDHLASTSAGEVDESQWRRALSTACLEARKREESVGGAAPAAVLPLPAEEDDLPQRTARGHLFQVVSIVRQTAEAAHALHEAGVVHRDIKPGNIMLTRDGSHAVLMDLGVAQLADEAEGRLTRTRQFVGTLRYASPEQVLAAGTLDRRSDVYSLGATLFELLTLRPLFGASDATPTPDLMLRIQTADPGRPRKLNPRIPRDLESIIQKCLEKDRARRYGTARELAEDLERFERGEPVEAEPPTLRYLLGKRLRRHKLSFAAAALLLVAALLGIASAVYRIERARRETELALFDSYTDSGLKAGLEGNSAEALLWFARASNLARDDAMRQTANRMRLSSFRNKLPRPLRALPHPGQKLKKIAFHPESGHLLALSDKDQCTLWDLAAEKPEPLPGGERPVSWAEWSPDGRTLLLAGPEGKLDLRRFPGGERLPGPAPSGPIRALAISPDGRHLALSTDRVRLWDFRKAEQLATEFQHPKAVLQLAFNERGDRLATAAEDGRARVFSVPGTAGKNEPLFEPVPHVNLEIQPVFLDRGRALLTVSDWAGISRWDVSTGKLLGSLPLLFSIQGITASRDGGHFIAYWENTAVVHDGATGRRLGLPVEHRGFTQIQVARFAPDGLAFLSADSDNSVLAWKVPDSDTREEELSIQSRPSSLATIPHQGGANDLSISRDGRFFATSQNDGLVRVFGWNEDRDDLGLRIGFERTAIALSPDGLLAMPIGQRGYRYSFKRETRVWEVLTFRPAGPLLRLGGILLGGAFTRDGRTVLTLNTVSISYDDRHTGKFPPWETPGRIRFWDWRQGREILPPIETRSEPLDGVLSPDGRCFAVACASGEILLVDPAAGSVTASLDCGARAENIDIGLRGMLCFSSDGLSLVAWNLGKTVQLWETGIWRRRFPPLSLEAPVQVAGFSRDGRLFFSASQGRLTVRDPTTGRERGPPLDHPGTIYDSVFGPGGEVILTSSTDGRARLWDWRSGRLVCPELEHPTWVLEVGYLPTPGYLFTMAGDASLRIWEDRTGKVVAIQPGVDGNQVSLLAEGRLALVAGSALHLVHLEYPFDQPHGNDDASFIRLSSEMLSGRKITPGGVLTSLTAGEWLEDWRAFRREFPGDCTFGPSRDRSRDWHRRSAHRADLGSHWEAARFHYERLGELGENLDDGRLLSLERFVRTWRFSKTTSHYNSADGAFVKLEAKALREIEASAREAPLFRSRRPTVDFSIHYPGKLCHVAGYAQRSVLSDRERRLKLLTGSDDALRVWLNGDLVLERFEDREAIADQDDAFLTLKPGENSLLVEVSQNYGEWELYLRLEDESGRMLRLTDEGQLEVIEDR